MECPSTKTTAIVPVTLIPGSVAAVRFYRHWAERQGRHGKPGVGEDYGVGPR